MKYETRFANFEVNIGHLLDLLPKLLKKYVRFF